MFCRNRSQSIGRLLAGGSDEPGQARRLDREGGRNGAVSRGRYNIARDVHPREKSAAECIAGAGRIARDDGNDADFRDPSLAASEYSTARGP